MDSVNICRCCLTEGSHKDLNSSYTWLDNEEIYSDMLLECFNIVLSADKMSSAICDLCIKTLRTSLCFKQQVLEAELYLIKWMKQKSNNDDGPEVKEEPEPESDGNESDNYLLCDAVNDTKLIVKPEEAKGLPKRRGKLATKRQTKNDTCKENNIRSLANSISDNKQLEVKLEPKAESDGGDSDNYFLSDTDKETEKYTTKTIASTKHRSRTAKKKTEADEWGAKKIKTLVNRLASSINSCDTSEVKLNKDMNITKTGKRKMGITKKEPKINFMWTSRGNNDKMKHKENLQTILKYSNATPFKNKSLLGYICGYCDTTYPDPVELRAHTVTDHNKERLHYMSNFDMIEYNVKLDITDLSCSICDQSVDNLTKLKDHLVKSHTKTIHSDIKDHIQQFKLKKGEVYDCAMCSSTYETFKMLKQHMNKHYSNYTCVKCHSSFVTKRSLNAHRTTHQEGSFKCDQCEKIFSSRAKKQYHEKTKHMGTRNISNCPYCDHPFRSYYQRNRHLVKVHNTEAQYKCNVCDKSYILKSLLMCHIKKNHLMERNCQCTECGFRFFSKKALNAHMVKHTGKRIFACEVCNKSYARKYTLREHMRIHNNDRRFKCDVCSVSFVQKCSLKSHLLSNHGISMAASTITSSNGDEK